MQGRLGIIIYKQGNNYEGRASGILKQYGKGRAGRTHCEGGGGGCVIIGSCVAKASWRAFQ